MWVRNSKGNIFVGNLPPDFADERLAETFDPYGIVLSAAVARDPGTGARLRYGFVDIATERAATRAINELDGTEVDGCKLNVKASERKNKNGAKKDGVAAARRPTRAGAPRRTPIGGQPAPTGRSGDLADMPPRHDTVRAADGAARPERPEPLERPQRPERPERPERPAQSSIIAAELDQMGPPPRRDFEVAYKPARRKTPNFQVERRTLPRRS
jgi:RNA recognition motif-containing protein